MDFFKKLLVIIVVAIAGQASAAVLHVNFKSVKLMMLAPTVVEYIHKAKIKGQLELATFVQKYAPPLWVCDLIEAAKGKAKKEGVKGFCCKGNDITRIINAERLRTCIDSIDGKGLNHLDVVRKYVYPIDGELYVFAQYVEPGPRKPKQEASMISLEEAKDLAILVEKTGYKDLSIQNIIRNSSGMLVIIDTEDRSFLGEPDGRENWCKLTYLENLIHHVSGISMYTAHRFVLQDEAKKWLTNRCNVHKLYRTEDVEELWPLPFSDRFDAAIGVKFEQVKKELGF